MYPHVKLGFIEIPSYTLMLVLGAVAFILYYIFNVEKRERLNKITSNRLLFTALVGFLVLGGSALVFNSIFHSIEKGKIIIGGITWLGGVIGLIPAMYLLIHFIVPKERGNALNRFSTMLPGLVIAHAFGRIGCFLGGCCYGGPTSLPIGVVYPVYSLAAAKYPDTSAEPIKNAVLDALGNPVLDEAGEQLFHYHYPSLPLFPTQLVEAIFELLLFAAMLILYKKIKNYNVELYCFAYGAFRFVLELWRGDSRGGTGIWLSPSQLMSLILIVGAVLLILYRNGKIAKGLKAKAELWRLEAESTPANAPVFPTAAKRTLDTLRKNYALVGEGKLSEEEFAARRSVLLNTVCDLSRGDVSVAADALREVRRLLSDGIISEDEYAALEERLKERLLESLALTE